ncbi:MAG TPA: type II toxin-antitoxin system VapC family toxin [Vicinamibacterales bacterium]|nr:type II toxin-antitoxin system VapC family toxin [Vicinamibacterales bacterium]
MTFVDANVPMYLVGAPHPHKIGAARLVERAIVAGESLVTDAEVFQEILHRYVAIERREAIQDAFDALSGVVDEVFPIDRSLVDGAKALVLAYRGLSAGDAIHAAVMRAHGVSRILSFDAGYDSLPGLVRIFE